MAPPPPPAPPPSSPPPADEEPPPDSGIQRAADARAPTWNGRVDARGAPCAVCKSPVRDLIDARLLAGDPWRTIAAEVRNPNGKGPCLSSISGHAERCIPDLIRRAGAERDAERGRRLLERLESLVERTEAQMAEAEALLRDAREPQVDEDSALGVYVLAKRALDRLVENVAGGVVEKDDLAVLARALEALRKASAALASADGMDPLQSRALAVRTGADASRTMKQVLDLYGKLTGFGASRKSDIREARQWPAFTRGIAAAVADCDRCSRGVEVALAGIQDEAA